LRSRFTLTFYKDVAPIIFEHCGTCHRPGQAAPFSLLDFDGVRQHAQLIAAVTRSRAMPPWLPERGYGRFADEDERRLSEQQIRTIQQWADHGAPAGNVADRPPIPKLSDGWQLGTPDLIVDLPQPYAVPPDSRDVFRNFVIPIPPSPRRYVRAVEFHPGNPRILHHATVAVDASRVSRQLDRDDPAIGFATMSENAVKVYGWSPGKAPFMGPADRAWPLESGSDLVLEMHMLPTGRLEMIQPTIGLFFAPSPPSRVPLLIKLESKTIDIPAGQHDYVVMDNYTLPADVEVQSVYPHAHYLAKDVKGLATLPDGTVKYLIWIKAWDFRWQDQYRYATPLFLPKGTTLTMRFTYDNSTDNPRNPNNPPQRVRNGPLSSDEMAVLWLEMLPRYSSDSGIFTRDFARRELNADIAGAELRVRTDATDASAHTLLATIYLRAGRVAEGTAHLQEALRLKPDDAEAHSDLGSALQMSGDTAGATRHLAEAARLRPNEGRIHFNFGNALLAGGKLEEAMRQYRRAIEINPDDADAHYNLAGVLGSQNKLDEAIAHLRRTLAVDPTRGDAHHNLALALTAEGKFDEALKDVVEALRIRPDSPQALNDLSLIPKLKEQWKSRP
jgi:Flp pilus assembly protein TadD